MEINHLITKKIEKGSRRLFFQLVNDSGQPMKGSVLMDLRWLLGSSFNINIDIEKVINNGEKAFIYFDMPEITAKRWKSMEWVWHDGDKKFQGRTKKVDKFEDLV